MKRKSKEPIVVTVDRLEPKGPSAVDAAGRRFEVRNAPLGAQVEIEPQRKGRGALRRVVEAAGDAVTPACPVFGTCGGCQLQHTSLARQRAAKQAMVERVVGWPSHPVDGTPDSYGYRNKLELSFSAHAYHLDGEAPRDLAGRAALGFHPPGWFSKVVPIAACPLASARMNHVIETVAALGLGPGWDARAHTGHFRHLVVREGEGLVVSIVTTSTVDAAEVERAGRAIAAIAGVSGVLWIVNDGVSDVATGAVRAVLAGSPDLEIRVRGMTLRLPYDGFFQVHQRGAQLLYDRIAGALGGGEVLLDLYCGNGVIGLCLAGGFRRVVGVELQEAAVHFARANAEANGVDGEWHAGPVEDVLSQLSVEGRRKVVVDPPRAGLHPRAAEHLATLEADMLVYVACNPSSLARDRIVLEAGRWRLTDLWTVDLFPQTPHVEAVARFEPKSSLHAE